MPTTDPGRDVVVARPAGADSHRSHRPAPPCPGRAFTLLELVVVLVVLALIAVIAIPTFNHVTGRSAERTATTTAESIARDAGSIAKLSGDDPTNAHLLKAVQELKAPGTKLQVAFRGVASRHDGVVGVKVVSTRNRVSYACVFIGDVSGTRQVLARPAPSGTCPATQFDGDAAASDVRPSAFDPQVDPSSIPYGDPVGGAPVPTTIPAATTTGVFLAVFDTPPDGSHPAYPGVAGGAFDDFSVTVDGNLVTSDDFDRSPGPLFPGPPWSADILSALGGAPAESLRTDGSQAAAGAKAGEACNCTSYVAMTPVAFTGTRVVSVKVSHMPGIGQMNFGFIDLSPLSIPVQVHIGMGGMLYLYASPPPGGAVQLDRAGPGAVSAGDTLSLTWNGSTAVVKRNGTQVLSGTP